MSDGTQTGRIEKSLGFVLLTEGLISSQDLDRAINIVKQTGQNLVAVLSENGFVTEEDIASTLAEHLGHHPIRVGRLNIPPEAASCVDERLCRMYTLVPIAKAGGTLTIAMADPLDLIAREEIKKQSGLTVLPMVSLRSEIIQAIDRAYKDSEEGEIRQIADDQSGDMEFSVDDEVGDGIQIEEQQDIDLDDPNAGPVVKIVNEILVKAIDTKCSDIHIEPFEKRTRLRYRLDGSLQTVNDSIPRSYHRALVSRIKVMSQMRLDETRLPQDQRTRIRVHGRNIDFRVSTVPSYHGEKIVMRILDKENLKLNLTDLGFEEDPLKKLMNALQAPFGMVLVTGPTGSGKTTTLYSAMSLLNQDDVNILTAEDPVEYELDGITQVGCRAEIGLTFANALRAFLRQDPDIIMLGEIRDLETADIAIKAALTGHLVLSTLHTNTAIEAIVRLEDMGVEPFMVACSVILTVAQRLVKKLCDKCKEPWEVPPNVLQEWKVPVEPGKKVIVYKAKGCQACNRGYKGRLACLEAFVLDEQMRDLIMKEAPITDIYRAAEAQGMISLRRDAMIKVLRGTTTREETIRATTD